MSILLSIAIPTYNRSEYLKEELESIIPQIIHYRNEIEIVVSDNASTDNTGEMIARVSKEYDFPIHYSRIENGIYFEDNFERAVNLSKGRYVQLAGDDDIMAPCFYQSLIKLLHEDFGLIHFNRIRGDEKCCNGSLYDKLYDESIYTGDVKSFVGRVGTGPGFMTSLVFRKDCWIEGLKFKDVRYYGYNFLGQLLQGALHLEALCCYYYFPLLIQRCNSHGFNKEYPLFNYFALPTILNDIDPEVGKKWINEHIINDNLTIARTFNYKEYYRSHSEEIKTYLSKRQKKLFRFMTSKYTPVFICKLYYRLLIRL